MSHKRAMSLESGCMDHLTRRQDLMPSPWITNCILLNQVHGAAEMFLQLGFHLHEIQEIPMRVGLKTHQKIKVTIRPKVIAQRRAKQRELPDSPFAAKIRDNPRVQFD